MVRAVPKCAMFDLPANAPIVLAGTPARLRGQIPLVNPTDGRIVVNGATLAGPAGGQSISGRVSLMSILGPGQAHDATIRASVRADTPPGLYHATLVVGENSHPADVHISENPDLEVVPDHVVVSAPPGSDVVVTVTGMNRGNVALTIEPHYAVVLDDDRIVCRTARSTLSEAARTASTMEEFLMTGVREADRHLTEMGVLGVAVEGGRVTIAPNTSVRLSLKLRLPSGLHQGTRYTAILPLVMSDLVFTLVPTAARGGSEHKKSQGRSSSS
jgi:hypothetical protein